jgi:hypothetical protein
MLTAKQERFCQNLIIKGLSQRQAYLDAYPTSKEWKPETVDEAACRLVNNNCKVSARIEELKAEQKAIIQAEAKWTRNDAYKTLIKLMQRAEREYTDSEELSSPCVSAILNATKELNTIFGVGEESDGKGVLEEILDAVRGVDDD